MLGLIYLLRSKRFEKYNNPNFILKLALWWLTIPMLLASLAGIGYGAFYDRQSLSEQWQETKDIQALVSQLDINEIQIKELPLPEPTSVDTLEVLSDGEIAPQTGLVDPNIVEESSIDSEESEPTLQEQAQEIFEAEQEHTQDITNEVAALSKANYWQATAYRVKTSIMWLAFTPIFALTLLLPIFLLGYWLVITDVIKNHAQHSKLFSYMARIGLGVGLIVTVGGLIIVGHPAVEHLVSIQLVGSVLFNVGQFFMAAGYLGLLVRLLDSSKWYNILVKLAPMGRMALTNYIMHSIILTSIFYGYAGGMYGEISRAPQMLIVLAILVIQIPLSRWWLTHYQFGPLEWLWRSLTYRKWQSFKVISS
jgi:hypothetical protein